MESEKDIVIAIKQGVDRLMREEAKEAIERMHKDNCEFNQGAVFGMYITASVFVSELSAYFGYSAEDVAKFLGIKQLADMLEKGE